MITARNVKIGYGQFDIFEDLSFDFPEKKTTVLMGLCKAGKSTLLKVLAGQCDAVDCEIEDCHFRENNNKKKIECEKSNDDNNKLFRKGMLVLPNSKPSYLTQKHNLGKASLYHLFSRSWPTTRDIKQKIKRTWTCVPEAARILLTLTDLETPLELLPEYVKRLALFTIAVSNRSSYLVLDEPDTNLWEEHMEWIITKLNDIRGKKTIILSTHNLEFSKSVADFVVLIVDGEIIEAASADKFFTNPSHPRAKYYVRMGS